MLKNSLKVLSVGFLVILTGSMNSANGMNQGSPLDEYTNDDTAKHSSTSSTSTWSGITIGNIQKKLLKKIDRDTGFPYAIALFSGEDLPATISRYAGYDEPKQNKIRNAVITVAVYGNGISLKGLASDEQPRSESTAITVGLCHFLCKVAPNSTVLLKLFNDDNGQFKIPDYLDDESRGIKEISLLFKQGAKNFSQVFCARQAQGDSASAKLSPPNYVGIFDSAVMLVEPTSSPLTYDRLASHVSAVSPGRPLTAPLLEHQHIHGDNIAKGRTNEENKSDDCCYGMCVVS
jgi:hypothetical protein